MGFFRIFEIIIFCFVVAMCDLVHDVEAKHSICLLLKAFAIPQSSLIFQKGFPDAVSSIAVKEGEI